MSMEERVVITGIGTVSPLGLTIEETWGNVLNGVSGIGPITLFDASALNVRVACEVKGFVPENYMEAREARRRDRFEQFATAAAGQAIEQSGLELSDTKADRIGVMVSSAIGGLGSLESAVYAFQTEGARKVTPFIIPMLMGNGAAGLISIDHGYMGPAFSVTSACASGADGIGTAWSLIRSGVIDVAIAGAAEATITGVGVAAFDRAGAISRRNDDYSHSPQPFDLHRDGLVMGEGAAILVLERESHARRRGVPILGEMAGYAASADGYHITAPLEDGAGGTLAIRRALDSARVDPGEVGYISAHGTGTILNDKSETRAIKSAFGERAYKIPVSSTKSMTGHMMGATGALEAIFCALAIRDGVVPPTIHYQTPDPECDLDYVPNEARQVRLDVAISNAFGFGGHNAVLVIRRYN
jgi:3-oxoacyl-[acyl-carrier-protein] synthase II